MHGQQNVKISEYLVYFNITINGIPNSDTINVKMFKKLLKSC